MKWIKNFFTRKRDKRVEQSMREMQGVCIGCGHDKGDNSNIKDKRYCSFCGEPESYAASRKRTPTDWMWDDWV